jgi:hypothetical protein
MTKQEPVGYLSEGGAERLVIKKQAHEQIRNFRLFAHDVPLYTTPQRTWVGLTDEERQDIVLEVPIDAVLITEAKLKDKNTRGQE